MKQLKILHFLLDPNHKTMGEHVLPFIRKRQAQKSKSYCEKLTSQKKYSTLYTCTVRQQAVISLFTKMQVQDRHASFSRPLTCLCGGKAPDHTYIQQ